MTLVDGVANLLRRIRVGTRLAATKKFAIEQANTRRLSRADTRQRHTERRGPAVHWTTVAGSLATCVIAIAATPAAPPPAALAKNGDTHVIGQGLQQTLDCNDATLIVNGTGNSVNAMGNCWAVTVMGSGNTIIADSVTHDITVYGYDQTVFYHNGAPALWDRGRELGMTNRLQQVPG
ncbi:MAG: hypothetical protein QOE30_1581 [Mycobacterium sp.]|jgi:Protein of unknown function (DUF3060)|nr:hypothetical protein [Mycobacterium sp.]